MRIVKFSLVCLLVLGGIILMNPSKAEARELKENTTYKIDLNGDGKKEKIQWKKGGKILEDEMLKVEINNNLKLSRYGYDNFDLSYISRVAIEDINKKDKYKELIVEFATDDDRCSSIYAFRWRNTKFKKLFFINAVKHDFMTIIGLQKGNGYVYGSHEYRDSNLGQGYAMVKYKIKNQGVERVGGKTLNISKHWKKAAYVAKKSLKVQKSLKNSRKKFLIKKGQTFYIYKVHLKDKTAPLYPDDSGKVFDYFYIKTENGKKGWIKNIYFDFFVGNYEWA